jgi:hypothetical protein
LVGDSVVADIGKPRFGNPDHQRHSDGNTKETPWRTALAFGKGACANMAYSRRTGIPLTWSASSMLVSLPKDEA